VTPPFRPSRGPRVYERPTSRDARELRVDEHNLPVDACAVARCSTLRGFASAALSSSGHRRQIGPIRT
jgi:hypothetical protein